MENYSMLLGKRDYHINCVNFSIGVGQGIQPDLVSKESQELIEQQHLLFKEVSS